MIREKSFLFGFRITKKKKIRLFSGVQQPATLYDSIFLEGYFERQRFRVGPGKINLLYVNNMWPLLHQYVSPLPFDKGISDPVKGDW